MIDRIRRYLSPTNRKAIRVCDGVIEIASNEMLAHGQYVFDEVSNEQLRAQGAICGGRKACLVGSMFLAHGDLPRYEDIESHYPRVFGGIFSEHREEWLSSRPALDLAYRAFNQATETIVDEHYSEWSGMSEEEMRPYQGWAEFYFERILESEDQETTDQAVIDLANDAKRLIRDGVVS